MKIKYFLLLIILMLFSCKKNEKVTFNISNIKELDIEGRKFQLIKTKLTNHTKDTLQYYMMSCSSNDFYYLYGRELFLAEKDCDKNTPIVIKLLPYQSKEAEIKLRKSWKIDYSNIKIGFFLYQAKKEKAFESEQINLKKNLIPSNEISF